jgi:hypothetical protein
MRTYDLPTEIPPKTFTLQKNTLYCSGSEPEHNNYRFKNETDYIAQYCQSVKNPLGENYKN